MCGGTIATCARRGDRVVLVTLTGGEASTQLGPVRHSAATLKRIRRRELRTACHLLGIERVHVMAFPDGRLADIPAKRLIKSIQLFIDRYQPSFIFSFAPDGVTQHADHQAVSRVVMAAVKLLGPGRTSRPIICLFGWPNSVRRRLGLSSGRSMLHYRLNVARFVNLKMRAIASHRSQVRTMERFAGWSARQQRDLFQSEYVVSSPGTSARQLKKILLT